jgi:hypothetical protein
MLMPRSSLSAALDNANRTDAWLTAYDKRLDSSNHIRTNKLTGDFELEGIRFRTIGLPGLDVLLPTS